MRIWIGALLISLVAECVFAENKNEYIIEQSIITDKELRGSTISCEGSYYNWTNAEHDLSKSKVNVQSSSTKNSTPLSFTITHKGKKFIVDGDEFIEVNVLARAKVHLLYQDSQNLISIIIDKLTGTALYTKIYTNETTSKTTSFITKCFRK